MGLGIPELMAIGGGVGLLTGGLKGGLQGAALGGIGGGLSNYVKGGSFLQNAAAKAVSPGAVINGIGTNALAGGDIAKGLAINAGALGGTSGFEAAMGLPNSAMVSAGAPLSSAFPTGAGMGLVQGASGNLVNPEYFLGAGTPFETFKGGQGLLSNVTGNLLDTLPDYVTPKNVLGAANIISNIQQPQRQMPTAPSGGVRQGSTQGLNVNMGMAAPVTLRKREDF